MSLTPSERIRLITEISKRLGREEWRLIDLTLQQFSLPSTDQWGSDQESYVVEMIGSADDDSLIGLARHVGLQVDGPTPVTEPAFWRPGMLRLFLSHLATHRDLAGEMQAELLKWGVSAFVAHNDIEPTREWQLEIESALSTTQVLVALLHPGFHDSKWTDQEIGFAMGRGIPVFSVRYGADPYGFIGKLQAFNGVGRSPAIVALEVFNVLRVHKQTESAMSDALVEQFGRSRTFIEAKERVGYLEDLTVWKPDFTSRIKGALESNSQISGAWGVPARIRALVEKWEREKS